MGKNFHPIYTALLLILLALTHPNGGNWFRWLCGDSAEWAFIQVGCI
jgi:hypothetical protein